jgi:hypothetical protein
MAMLPIWPFISQAGDDSPGITSLASSRQPLRLLPDRCPIMGCLQRVGLSVPKHAYRRECARAAESCRVRSVISRREDTLASKPFASSSGRREDRTVNAGKRGETVTLWRPAGPDEIALVEASGWREWPPRLPEQPIFYPVLTEECAT